MPPKFQPKPLRKNRVGIGNYFLFQNPDLQEMYAVFCTRPDSDEIFSTLNDKRFTVRDGDVSYRVINHWTMEGVIPDDREEGSKGWRKLSPRDLLWLRVLNELRQFGMPLEKLRVTYDNLFTVNGKPNSWKFDFAMALCLLSKPVPMFIVVFNDGDAEVATLADLEATDAWVGYQHPYIRINLNTLCCEMYNKEKYLPALSMKGAITKKEQELVDSIRQGEDDEINLHLKDGKIDRIDKTKKIAGGGKIADLLHMDFGEITIQVADGKPVYARQVKKERQRK